MTTKTIRLKRPDDPLENEIKARRQLLQLAELRKREPPKQTIADIAEQLRRLAEQAAALRGDL